MQAKTFFLAKTTETDSTIGATATTDRNHVPRYGGINLSALTSLKKTGNLPRVNKQMRPRTASSVDAVIATQVNDED